MANNSHGHTPAAWTAVIIIVAGFVVAAIGVLTLTWQIFWFGGVGLVVLGLIAGKVMQMMGLGQTERPATRNEDERQRSAAEAQGIDG